MIESCLLKGMAIGILFGVPAGVVGILAIQRTLSQGILAGFMTGMGSSAADVFYAGAGCFGITLISDFLLKYRRGICMAGCMLVVVMGILCFRKTRAVQVKNDSAHGVSTCFFSAFAISMANPATIVSFMMVFSLFRIDGTESLMENIRLVFGIFCGTCIWWAVVALAAGRFRDRITENYSRKLNRIFGVLMVLFGIVLGIKAVSG